MALLLAAACLAALPAVAEPVTIAALGDSITQGYGLPQDQGLVPQLQAWLTAHGADAVVVNAGVSGDTTAGGLSRVDWTLSDDTDAMIVALGGNDILRGIGPETSRANLAGILQAARDRGVEVLLVGLPAPNNYGPGYKAAFEAIYPSLAEEYGVLFHPNLFQPIIDRGVMQGENQSYMQPDGIHPSAEGVALLVDALGPSVLELIDRTR